MIRKDLLELEVNPEKSFDFSNKEMNEIVEGIDNKISESTTVNENKRILSIRESKKSGKFFSLGFLRKNKKEIHYLNMEEKKQMVLNGEQIPIIVGESNFNECPVKYYSRTLKRKMKL